MKEKSDRKMEKSVKVTLGVAVKEKKSRPFLVEVFTRLIKEKPMGVAGGVIVLLLFFVGILADVLAPYGMNEINLARRLEPPSAMFLIGTDNLGRDLLTRVIYGARISMIVGLATSALGVFVATLIGIVSGYFGGKTDIVIQRFVDAFMCFPALFFNLTVMAILGPGLVQVIFVLGILRGISSSRVVRGAVIGIKENVYIEAARTAGASPVRMLTRHVLPNVIAPVITIFTLSMGQNIISEASLSFLGFGVPPPMPSWGGMLSGAGRQYMADAPWLALWPGLALAVVVYGINMLGDAVRDITDPRLRGGLGRYEGGKGKKASKALESVKLDNSE